MSPKDFTVNGKEREPHSARLSVELAGHASLWGRAVSLEAERVLGAATMAECQIDSYLFILALRQVIRSSAAMNRAVGQDEELTQAHARFLAENPQASLLRDMPVHFDEYEGGTGRLQTNGDVGALFVWLGRGEGVATIALSSNLTIEVSAAASAAQLLTEATLGANDRFLAQLSTSSSSTDGNS